MNQKSKLVLFGIGGLLLFLVAVFGVAIARYEPPPRKEPVFVAPKSPTSTSIPLVPEEESILEGATDIDIPINLSSNSSIPPPGIDTSTLKACTDSDGGRDYFTKGTISGIERNIENAGTKNQKTVDGGEATTTDRCIKTFGSTEANQSSVLEYYCGSDGRITGQSYACPNGCFDGACKGLE